MSFGVACGCHILLLAKSHSLVTRKFVDFFVLYIDVMFDPRATASSRFRVACVSCQHCASAVALPYLAIYCCCLSIFCYVVRGCVTPSRLHSISCSIMHDILHDACPSDRTLHSRTSMHCIRSMHSLSSLPDCLRTCFSRTDTHTHTHMHAYIHGHVQTIFFLMQSAAAWMSRLLAYYIRCLRLLIERRC